MKVTLQLETLKTYFLSSFFFSVVLNITGEKCRL